MYRTFITLSILFVSLISFIKPAAAETYPVILRGKVTMPDGSPPTFQMAIERICSDEMGSQPGPLTDKKGEYLWRMEVDPMRTRACVIRATHAGYQSTTIDISGLNGYLDINIKLEPLVITSLIEDPYAILLSESKTPLRAQSAEKAAMKALDARNYSEAVSQFRSVVQAAPRFASGWHALGVVLEHENALKEARDAYEHAIQADSKNLPPYMTLTILCLKNKDWECAAKTADALIKVDKKQVYPVILLHRAVALFGLHDLETAAASVQEFIRLDPNHRKPRAEYVYGRILQAKGDLDSAREHISRYLDLDKNAPDAAMIRRNLQDLGKQGASGTEPDLEYP
jgi:Flp pilus assembly protein TadD